MKNKTKKKKKKRKKEKKKHDYCSSFQLGSPVTLYLSKKEKKKKISWVVLICHIV